MKQMNKFKKKSNHRILIFITFLSFIVAGCSAVSVVKKQTKNVVKAITFQNSPYKKRVAIMPFENKTFVSSQNVEHLFQNHFLKAIEEQCPEIIWLKPGDPAYPKDITAIPRLVTGQIDNLALAKTGRLLGFNAILTGNIANIYAEEKEKGILIFKDTHYYECSRINFQIFDMATAAKLLDESIECENEIEGTEFDAITAKDERGIMDLENAMSKIASEGAEKVCDTINDLEWRGYVKSVEGDKIILSCGRETDVKPGDIFEVFETGEVIEGKYGQKFIIPGDKTGEITITKILVGRSEAVPSGKIEVKPGFAIKPK